MTNIADILKSMQSAESALIMGIVNASPDSFSTADDREKPLDRALRLLDEGADIIDLGGESTRPGAEEISTETEIERVMSVLPILRKARPDVCISVDTRKSVCAKIFLDNGADIVNDVSGLTYSPCMAQVAASFNAGLIITHSIAQGKSETKYRYDNVVCDVCNFLQKQYDSAIGCGVDKAKIIVDPGLGFSKNTEENFMLLNNIREIKKIAPVLIGHSRKRFIRDIIRSTDNSDCDSASALISVLASKAGAAIVRVHDVKQTAIFLNIAGKIKEC